MDYFTLSKSELDQIKTQIKVVVLTATNIETIHFLNILNPLPRFQKLIRYYEGDLTYTIGILGNYPVVQVQCEMGSLGTKSSTVAAMKAYTFWKPAAFVMVGIAFGADRKKQKIGDILISSAIIPYEKERIGKTKNISRAKPLNAGSILLDRARNIRSCSFSLISSERKPEAKIGEILSGEKLIDNEDYKKSLLSIQPEAIGGEMEGAGLASFAISHKIEWILIKSICDFADGKKRLNKEQFQNIAAHSSSCFLLEMFSQVNVFEDLDITPYEDLIPISSVKEAQKGNVLFEKYTLNDEPYYVKRNIDQVLSTNLIYYSIWISGDSGVGKTSVVLRYLIQNSDLQNISVGLANSSCSKPLDLFTEFYNQLCLKFSIPITNKKFKLLTEAFDRIFTLLNEKISNDCIIFIDEVPTDDYVNARQDFVTAVYALLSHQSSYFTKAKIKFIVSTFFDPINYIKPTQEKIKEVVKFYNLKRWEVPDIKSLTDIITSHFVISLNEQDISNLIKSALGSPRFVKKVFKDFILNKEDPNYTFSRIVNETKQDFNHE